MTWVYWEQLLSEFGMSLDNFGRRASVRLGNWGAYRYPARG